MIPISNIIKSMILNKPCPKCGEKQLVIIPAEDSHYKEVGCMAGCGFKKPLKYFNKKYEV